jgi:hypothetical protein
MTMRESINLGNTLQENGGLSGSEFFKILGSELLGVSLMTGMVPLLGKAGACSGKGIIKLVLDGGLNNNNKNNY